MVYQTFHIDKKMHFHTKPVKLVDSRLHGIGTELLIVEGDSAASSVASLRDAQFQAVLPMQGKPLNAIKASESKVWAYPLFQALLDSLGVRHGDLFATDQLRFEKILLLFDPDADGIHCGALMLMFFYRYLPELLREGKIHQVHPPWAQLSNSTEAPIYTYSEAQTTLVLEQLRAQGKIPQVVRYRGLSGIDRDILINRCINPATRLARVLNEQDAQMAIEVFGGNGR